MARETQIIRTHDGTRIEVTGNGVWVEPEGSEYFISGAELDDIVAARLALANRPQNDPNDTSGVDFAGRPYDDPAAWITPR